MSDRTPSTCGTPEDARCLDPEWAADDPSVCPDAPSITGLRVAPSSGEVEVNSHYPFSAYLTFSDGQEKNVTDKSAWSSSNTNIADVDGGVCDGKMVGVATIEATYRGYFDFGQLTVVAQCFQVGMDIVLLFDRSVSMESVMSYGMTRIKAAQQAALAFVNNCIFTKDQVAVISFAGIYETSASGVQTKRADATTLLVLSQSVEDVKAAIVAVKVNEPCQYTLPDGGSGTRCATSIGGGLQAAKDELGSLRSRAGVRKVIVLLTDGLENVCSPNPVVITDELKAQNVLIIVVALNVPNTISHVCGVNVLAQTYLKSLCACNLFYTADDAGALMDIYSRIPSIICKNQADPCFYYFAPPTSNPPVPPRTRDQYNYRGFLNWDVTWGSVDLFGVDLWPNLQPGHGMFVNLNGSGDISSGTRGEITSKRSFAFSGARYRLSMKLAGNLRQSSPPNGAIITVGEIGLQGGHNLLETSERLPWTQEFRDYTFDFSPAASASGRIIISGTGPPRFGPLLDAVKLENLDTGEVLLEDSFDSENPI